MRLTMPTLFVGALLLCGCNSSQEPTKNATDANSAPSGPPFSNVATVQQLMNWILDPQADIVWGAVGSIITKDGEEQLAPKNDDEWNAVRNAAATVAESGNLLMLEGRARDNGDWMTMTRKMIDLANECVQAAEAKDLETLFTAGGDLYLACTACHAKYVIGEPLKEEDLPK